MKRKQGENEAIQILKSKGYIFDERYSDDGSEFSKADLRFSDGRYLEVTHTRHNYSIFKNSELSNNSYSKKSIKEQLAISQSAKEALDRVNSGCYECDEKGRITEKGKIDYQRDAKTVKNHFGYDCTVFDFNKRFSEFGCDMHIITMSSDNILHEICEDKGKKYNEGNTDLFIFVLDGEMDDVKRLIETISYNSVSDNFFKMVFHSPFKKIFLCVWDYHQQCYIIDNPELLLLEVSNNSVNWRYL